MRSYLLGTLDGERRTQFEERILFEPSVYEELLVAEEELIDQYLAGDLSTVEREQFESHFLITAERQKNLRFGKLLRKYLDRNIALTEQEAVPISAPPSPLDHSFSLLRTPVRRWSALALAAVILACTGIILVGWFGSRREVAGVSEQTIPRVVIVTLVPGSAGIEGLRVNVPPKGTEIKLELKLTNPTFRNYKSELFRENKSLQISDELRIEAKGEQSVVPFTITGEMLSPGDYQVKLSGVLDSGADEFIDNYSFRVVE